MVDNEGCNETADAAKPSADATKLRRPMKFPYTFSAKIAQFPLKFYIRNQWIWRYYLIAMAVSLPIFYKINKLANSEENKAKWVEIKAREAAEHETEH